MRIDNQGYLERITTGRRGKSNKGRTRRNWWLIKSDVHGYGQISLGSVSLPKHLVGKKVRFKIEIIKEEK